MQELLKLKVGEQRTLKDTKSQGSEYHRIMRWARENDITLKTRGIGKDLIVWREK